MVASSEFEQELQEALTRLYDPDYQPSEGLCRLTGCDPQEGALGVQSAIIRMIEKLEPPPNTPSSARPKLIYDLLHSRFVLKLTQEETAECLHISVASAWRAQREAIHALARLFWERHLERGQPATTGVKRAQRPESDEAVPDAQVLDWRSQAVRELASLRASAPDAVTNVAEAISDVLELQSALIPEGDVDLQVRFVQPDLITAVHPAVLRQILIAAIGRLARYIPSGPIRIFAGLEDGNAKITITGSIAPESEPTKDDLLHDILTSDDVSIEAHIEGNHVYLWVELPSVGKVTVLAVDDNPDMADFYRRCTEGTSYHIVHETHGQGLLETIKAIKPDIIVLDVMLPDIDGWKVLMRLRANPTTRPIPVIVCSVVREQDLALSLGAFRYLEKPVRPREFIRVLDQAHAQVPTTSPKFPTRSAEAC